MDARYEFRLTEPGEKLHVGIYDYVEGPLLLVAGLDLTAQELTDASLAACGPPLRTDVAAGVAADPLAGAAHRVAKASATYRPQPPPEEETSL